MEFIKIAKVYLTNCLDPFVNFMHVLANCVDSRVNSIDFLATCNDYLPSRIDVLANCKYFLHELFIRLPIAPMRFV